MDICEGDIKQTARVIRKAFVQRKRMYEPGYSPKSARHKRIWEKAARICLAADIPDPEEFVEAQFRALRNPYPNVLSNQHQAMQRYKIYKESASDQGRAKIIVASQLENILGRAKSGLDMRSYLLDPLESISPLMRWTIAMVFEYTDVVESTVTAAIDYAKKNPDVAAVIKERFPGVPPCQQV